MSLPARYVCMDDNPRCGDYPGTRDGGLTWFTASRGSHGMGQTDGQEDRPSNKLTARRRSGRETTVR